MKRVLLTLCSTLFLIISISSHAAEKVTVFAAASLTNAMEDIATAYKQTNSDSDIAFSFASSSVLARQIEQGAPVDIFMSADQQWMDYLLEKKITATKETLLKNSLVLIAPNESPLNQITVNKTTRWDEILPKNEKLAVGDPDHVPAGLYTKESLTNLGVYQQLEPQLARASNVRDALMLVERGEAVLGAVYSTDAKISKNVKIIGEFPAETFAAIEYPITLITTNNPSAQKFYDYLKSAEAKAIFEQYGFVTQ